MLLPDGCTSNSLWPNKNTAEGAIPDTNFTPVWEILSPKNPNGLDKQLIALLTQLGSKTRDNVAIDESGGLVYIDDSAKIESNVQIIGPAYIGPNVDVRHAAYIREFSWICANSVVGHCSEIKHSILLPNSKAPHFNYVGDSVLGGYVNLGAGVKLSNLRNDGKEIFLKIKNKKIKTGLRKFGALLGENCQLGCNSVLNPGVILGPNTFVNPNITVTGFYDKNSHVR